MPAPSTPRRSSNRDNARSASKPPSEVGKPLEASDANSVRDRIRKWQEQGGGVVTGSDAGGDKEEDEQPVTRERRVRSEKRPASRRQSGRGREDEKPEIPRDRSMTPRKRVVSDEHWKKKKRSPTDSKGDLTPRLTPRLDGLEYQTTATTPTREERRQKRREERALARLNRESGDGNRISTTPSSSRRQSDNRKVSAEDVPDTESGIDDRAPERLPTASPSPKDSSDQPCKDAGSKQRRKSRDQAAKVESSPKSVQDAFSETRGSGISRKGSLFSQVLDESKKIFTKSEPPPMPAPRVPSIEAWLQETPDPFVEADQATVEVPPPLSTGSRRRRRATEEPTIPEDPNQIWDEVERIGSNHRRASGTEHRRKRRSRDQKKEGEDGTSRPPVPEKNSPKQERTPPRTSPKTKDTVQETRELSPSTLKRRGANGHNARSRRNSSPLKDGVPGQSSEPPLRFLDSEPESHDPFKISRPLPNPRAFPPTGGHRLSTIASVETFPTRTETQEQNEGLSESNAVDADWMHNGSNGLKRRLTTHADLMSVLSLPGGHSKSIKSARSIRTNRSKLATATIDDLMQELASDESKYMRELRTLVDGVIPVLLSCVLSKSDAAIAAGLFRPSSNANSDDNAFTKPIVDMGVALERLKTLHKRIPTQDPDSLLTWAQGAQRVYTEYLRAWRLGFQDVVVNLAPATTDGRSNGQPDSHSDDGMARDENGDVVNGDGEKVDVAFLLKRPLVRLKYLAKTFKGINMVKPSSKAEEAASKYQTLVETARRRSNEERARLEDEAAASIDPSRTRDPRTMAVLTGVSIDKTRTVSARDYFNLTLHHSTGQRVDCKTELLLRDNAPGAPAGGDLLICEVDDSGRWLLFPPVETSRISARIGDLKGEIVVMVRGVHARESWQELLALRMDDEQASLEWVQLLGSTPMPPKLVRSQSFIARHKERSKSSSSQQLSVIGESTTPAKSRTPSPREIEVPIGEPSVIMPTGRSRAGSDDFRDDTHTRYPANSMKAERPQSPLVNVSSASAVPDTIDILNNKGVQQGAPESFYSNDSPVSSLKRRQAKRQSYSDVPSPKTPSSAKTPAAQDVRPGTGIRKLSRTDELSKEWMSSPETRRSSSPDPHTTGKTESPSRPGYIRAPSSTPSKELPTIPRVRANTQPNTPVTESPEEGSKSVPQTPKSVSTMPEAKELPFRSSKVSASSPLTNTIRDKWSALTGWNKETTAKEEPRRPPRLQKQERRKLSDPTTPFTEDIPSPPAHRSPSPSPVSSPVVKEAPAEDQPPPVPPPHRSTSPAPLKPANVPILQPPPSPTSARKGNRRSSSPLKHEYAPSTASETDEESDASEDASDRDSETSEEELEDGDAPTPLMPIDAARRFGKVNPPSSLPTLASATLAPSNSASQAPYRTVPSQSYTRSAKTIASIFSWSDRGVWEPLHPDECSVVISDGLIEAYEMTAAHSGAKVSEPAKTTSETTSDISSAVTGDERPLVALEVTPLVPLRRGTALDISIRSPPTEKSKIRSGQNIMFRSRNAEECEHLYALINQARINNPTYIALQNARPAHLSQPASAMGRNPSIRSGSRASSWFFGSRRSSYRATSAPKAPSIGGASESSVGTMTSAFSALKRFGTGSNAFNLSRSSVTSRNGGLQKTASLYSSSSGSRTTGSGTSTPASSQVGAPPGEGIGLSNAKIRMYERETVTKWRDMGAARLTILPAPSPLTTDRLGASNDPRLPSSDHSPHKKTGREKRIVINGKTRGEVLLDVCLGESCFERIARTGIALSVWEEADRISHTGGVINGRTKVYMIQMKTEAEAAYTFGLVGKLRY